MATKTGWSPGKTAIGRYQRSKITFDANASGADSAELEFFSGQLIKIFIDVNTLKATTSTITFTNDDGEVLFTYTAPGSPANVTYYPMQDGSCGQTGGALTTKQSTPLAFVGKVTVALASANEHDNPVVYVTAKQ